VFYSANQECNFNEKTGGAEALLFFSCYLMVSTSNPNNSTATKIFGNYLNISKPQLVRLRNFKYIIFPRNTTDCLANFTVDTYLSFNNREYLVVTFIDVRGAFDFENIPLFISLLNALNLALFFTNFIFRLFSHRTLNFLPSFGITSICSTKIGLSQGSYLSQILFNITCAF
jgi:hypothetical protein